MKLSIHIGTEKSGSSSLQTKLVRSRRIIGRNGIHIPCTLPRHETRMAAGLVSAGNAYKVVEALETRDTDRLRGLLDAQYSSAVNERASSVLLTSELLLPALSGETLSTLVSIAHSIGFSKVDFLVVLRDPTDQCLSLYKHRAKRGTAGDIAEWMEHGYRLPQELKGFRLQAESLGITPTVRGYTQAPGGLDQRFFEDWLGVPTPDVEMPQRVNPSLTLSELVLIHQMAGRRPALVTPLYEALLAIDPSEKVQGEAMAAHARAVATAAVAAHAEEWAAWNRYLPPDEALTIPEAPAEIPPRPRELGLTEHQMAALAAVLDEAATSRFLARMVWQSRIRPVLSRLKHGSRRSKS